jgi:geranylgeranyl reductase family protein
MQSRVLIIGAGPGGAAAAVHLAQRGVRDVLLVDKDHFPRDKTCGSALSPNGIQLIGELGIGDEVARLGYWIRGLRLKTPGNREMFLASPGDAAVVLLRKHFDNLLVERAQALGVRFRGGFKVTELVRQGGRVVGARGRSGDSIEELRADLVLCADGAHSIFSHDPRPKRTISTLMGWWEDFPIEPGIMDMIFDRNLSPLYGWMFPEAPGRVNIGICIDGELPDGSKRPPDLRRVFRQFLDDHFRDRLRGARQLGKWKGHPISYTTWVGHCTEPGMLYLGEGARLTHNVTGEGIYQAMKSGTFAADAVADALAGVQAEEAAWRRYTWRLRREFTVGFTMGHVLRGVLKTPLLEVIASAYNSETVRRWVGPALSWALTGTAVAETKESAPPVAAEPPLERRRAS